MKIGLVQPDIAWEDKRANFQKAQASVRLAASEGCGLVVFPEMFSSGFSMNVRAVAEEGLGETVSFLSKLAGECNVNLLAGFPIKTPVEDKGRNMAFFFDRKGKLDATYTKIHPFCFSGEDRHYAAGEHTSVFDVDGVPSSVFICYDLRFPEVFRAVAKDVRMIFVLANWPASRVDQWEALLKARAIENQCFVIGVNRAGTDGAGLLYPGASQVIDPLGVVLCRAGAAEEFMSCEVDPGETDRVRAEFPFLNDMRWKM